MMRVAKGYLKRSSASGTVRPAADQCRRSARSVQEFTRSRWPSVTLMPGTSRMASSLSRSASMSASSRTRLVWVCRPRPGLRGDPRREPRS